MLVFFPLGFPAPGSENAPGGLVIMVRSGLGAIHSA